jgi:hypothetical protein
MSTKGTLFLEPDLWRDIVASEADRALRAVQYVAKPSAPRPTCRKCGVIDVMHFTSGPCPGFEAQR